MEIYGVIYKLTCVTDGNKCYIGQTTKVCSSYIRKTYEKGHGEARPKIRAAIETFGWKNFTSETICKCDTDEELDQFEDDFIVIFDSVENGYNCKRGGAHGKHCKATKEKISVSKKKLHQEHPEIAKQQGISMQRLHKECPEIGEKHSVDMIKHFNKPGAREKNRIAQKKNLQENPESLKRLQNLSAATRTPELIKNQSVFMTKYYKDNPEALKKLVISGHTPEAHEKQKNAKRHKMKALICITTNRYFESMHETSKKTGLRRCVIRNHLLGKQKSVMGFTFRYATQEEIEDHNKSVKTEKTE